MTSKQALLFQIEVSFAQTSLDEVDLCISTFEKLMVLLPFMVMNSSQEV